MPAALGTVMCLVALGTFAQVGCNRAPVVAAPAKPQDVQYVVPTEEVVTEYEEFTGRTAPAFTVDIRARVSGYMNTVNFKDGATIQEGDLLFEIDPRSYKAEADRTAAAVEQLKVRIERLRRMDERGRQLLQTKSISDEAYDLIAADLNEARASLNAATAQKELADLNLTFTQIKSPITGRISRRLVDPGNLVKADDTLLANIVTVDPLYVYFDMNERTVLRIRRMRQESRNRASNGNRIDVQLALADETDFHRSAMITFIDNQVDSATGTLRFRAELDNPTRMLTPGLFVRLRFPIGEPHSALLVPEESLATDQGQRCVYVLSEDGVVSYRRVQVGVLTGGKRVIEQGLAANERVAVTGLQRIRPGAKVNAKPFVDSTATSVTVDDSKKTSAGEAAQPKERTAAAN